MVNVLKYNDLTIIEQFLRDAQYDNENIEFVMYIETQDRLNKLNMEYFKLNNPNEPYPEFNNISDIKIRIGNVKFIYKLKTND